jgi:16S rRNA G966 N2-methylase RsmD
MKFNKAPLPFVGQKRNFLKQFAKVLNENIDGQGEDWTIIDVFGGSGLLAHHAKRLKPNARVIYNDFDNYADRLAYIEDINRLRQQLAVTVKDIPIKSKLDKRTQSLVIEQIRSFKGYIDLGSLQTWLLFSGDILENLDQIYKESVLYNRVKKSDYPLATGYLDGVEVVSKSFDVLLPDYVDNENTLLVLDPPYLFSEQKAYRKAEEFRFISFIKLMTLIRPPFILFSNKHSEILEYLDYAIEQKDERFAGYDFCAINATISKKRTYKDYMVYKF